MTVDELIERYAGMSKDEFEALDWIKKATAKIDQTRIEIPWAFEAMPKIEPLYDPQFMNFLNDFTKSMAKTSALIAGLARPSIFNMMAGSDRLYDPFYMAAVTSLTEPFNSFNLSFKSMSDFSPLENPSTDIFEKFVHGATKRNVKYSELPDRIIGIREHERHTPRRRLRRIGIRQ